MEVTAHPRKNPLVWSILKYFGHILHVNCIIWGNGANSLDKTLTLQAGGTVISIPTNLDLIEDKVTELEDVGGALLRQRVVLLLHFHRRQPRHVDLDLGGDNGWSLVEVIPAKRPSDQTAKTKPIGLAAFFAANRGQNDQ